MLDEAAIAITTGAASNVIAYLAQGRTDAIRNRVSAIFRRGGTDQEDEALAVLANDTAALSQRRINQAEATARWAGLFAAALAAHPSTRPDIEALASTPPPVKTVSIGSQHNHGSGTFVGGDNHGSIQSGSQSQP
ncbi:hypothetical protein [Streptomyces sp. NBC_00059]|uniref:hypothetical protein n=1 Tax=Streptomyces sp. NBC_00059 TaxID=2975635 RepID=UPI002254992D|nr:hypothetical protein [Streptomyces sp. NBC_00059]MCX5410751.1 hypothetical protein [Streptomyces sp. NBC_00059]